MSMPEPPEPTPVEPLADLPPVSNDLGNHSIHITDLRRRMRKLEESRPHFVREVQRMILNGFILLNEQLKDKWIKVDKLESATNDQTVILYKIQGGIRALGIVGAILMVVIPAAWAMYVHFAR